MTPRGQQSKLIPITIKRIATFYEYKNPFAVKFFDLVFQFYCNQNPIYKDIYRFIKSDSVMIVPLGFNEINNYHNLKEMFLDKYKTAAEIKYNWNKRNPNLSYLIIKSYNYVCPDQREKLTQIVECPFSEVKINSYYTYTSNVMTFLIWVLQDRCSIDDENQLQIIKDYVYMCFRTHTKVNINFKSVKKIRAAHDELTKRYSHKDTPVIKIKKDTAFKQLRKILPKEFEWIKTRKRLIEETVIQHHCVWSYADKINKDKCQIYSYVDSATGKKYTLEFVIRKGKYACVQLYGVNNTFDETAKKLKKDVCDLIANHK